MDFVASIPLPWSIDKSAFLWPLACWLALAPRVEALTGQVAPPPAPPPPAASSTAPAPAAAAPEPTLYIREYRVQGAHLLPPVEVETAVYPFLGPARNRADVEKAAAALTQIYHDKGYQTVTVDIPEQQGRGGIILLQVNEQPVGRLRVHGSHYYDLEQIKKAVPSMAQGTVPNFNQVTREVVGLNQWPDRKVTPALRAGEDPNTVDIDLNVQDSLPLHGSVELNNRYSANTTQLRLSGSVSYGNLWQLGHSAGISFQLAPLRTDDEEVFSAFYLFRIPSVDWLTVVLQGTKQTSKIQTNDIGSATIATPGEILGLRMNITLPPGKDFYQSLSLGVDYKHFAPDNPLFGPIFESSSYTYFPASITYNGTWAGKGYTTDLTLGTVFGFRGTGSSDTSLGQQRVGANANFIYLHGDLSHEHDLPGGLQGYGRIHGQLADQPLVNTEQLGGGGLDTVRGYLEAETLGDSGIFGTLELRSPSLLPWMHGKGSDWRFYAFSDAGYLTIEEPLPEQTAHFSLASVGIGTRLNLLDHLHGSFDAALPLLDQTQTMAGEWRLTFRVWADF